MQNDGLSRSPHCLSLIAGIALMVVALGFAFFPHTAEAVPKIYVANFGSNTISRANLDGTGGEDLGNLGPGGTLSGPVGIALDVSGNKMYVVNMTSGRISRANLDGTGGEDLGNLGPGGTLSSPYGIALDVSGNKMYVVNRVGRNFK
jgi:DNA-binding beta-propeller fold protein YncE